MKNLISKIELKKAKIGIVGLGYVGLPVGVRIFIKWIRGNRDRQRSIKDRCSQ